LDWRYNEILHLFWVNNQTIVVCSLTDVASTVYGTYLSLCVSNRVLIEQLAITGNNFKTMRPSVLEKKRTQ